MVRGAVGTAGGSAGVAGCADKTDGGVARVAGGAIGAADVTRGAGGSAGVAEDVAGVAGGAAALAEGAARVAGGAAKDALPSSISFTRGSVVAKLLTRHARAPSEETGIPTLPFLTGSARSVRKVSHVGWSINSGSKHLLMALSKVWKTVGSTFDIL